MNEQRMLEMLQAGVRPQALADEIDRHFDAMLYEGMPLNQAMRVQQERDRCHGVLAGAVFAAAAVRP